MTRIACLLACLVLTVGAAAWSAPLEVYGRPASIENVTVSPSGARLALVTTDGERRSVAVQDLNGRRFITRATFGDVPVQAIRWAGEEHLLITTLVRFDPPRASGGLRDWRRVHVFDLAAQRIRPLLDGAAHDLNVVLRSPMVRQVGGRAAVFLESVQYVDNRGFAAVYQVDLATGQSRLVQRAVWGSTRWLVDDRGEVVAREMLDEKTRRTSVDVRVGDRWRDVEAAGAPTVRATLVALGPDGRSIVYRRAGEGSPAEFLLAPLDGGPIQRLDWPAHHSVVSDPQTGRAIGHAGWDGDSFATVYLDAADAAVYAALRVAYPALSLNVFSWSDNRAVTAALVDTPGRAPGFGLYDYRHRRAEWIGPERAGLADADVAPLGRVRVKASDGLDLSGYLTRPPGRAQARDLPLIVLPHDGRRATPVFDWFAQALASRGYAVLQLNFRGTPGLGAALAAAGQGEIGRRMQTDLSDAVDALAASGAIDPKRVCIVGEGYGGYAALTGLMLQPNVYRCGVSLDGFFELTWPRDLRPDEAERARRALGVDGPQDPRLVTYSPLKRAAEIRAPVLLVHQFESGDAQLERTEAMAAALRKAGRPAELLVQASREHRPTRVQAREQMLNAVVAFVEKHNPPN